MLFLRVLPFEVVSFRAEVFQALCLGFGVESTSDPGAQAHVQQPSIVFVSSAQVLELYQPRVRMPFCIARIPPVREHAAVEMLRGKCANGRMHAVLKREETA